MNHFEENTAGITSITSSLSLEEEATPGGKLTPLQLASTSLMVHTVVHAGLGPASYSQVKKKSMHCLGIKPTRMESLHDITIPVV